MFGLIAMIWGNGVIQIVGMFAFLWPFSIPARAVLTTTKASRLFTGGCQLSVYEDRLEFIGQTPLKDGRLLRMIIPMEQVRDVVERKEFYVIRTIRLSFVLVAKDAVPPSGADTLLGIGLASEEPDAIS